MLIIDSSASVEEVVERINQLYAIGGTLISEDYFISKCDLESDIGNFTNLTYIGGSPLKVISVSQKQNTIGLYASD